MKKLLTIIGLAAITLSGVNAQVTVATWTFETSLPTTAGPFNPEVGAGSATGFHASASAVYSNPVGNGSAESYSSNFWAIGDYYQFQVDLSTYTTLDYNAVSFSFDQTRSTTGPATFGLYYSLDGSSFSQVGSSYTLTAINWSSGTNNPASTYSFLLPETTFPGLLADSSVFFRITAESAPGATTGTNRVDNVTVGVIPEPTTVALIGLGTAFALMRIRRRSRA